MGMTEAQIKASLDESDRLRTIRVEDCRNKKLLPMCRIKFQLQTSAINYEKMMLCFKIIDFIYHIQFTKVELVNSTVFEKNDRGVMWAAPSVRLNIWMDNTGYTSFEILDENRMQITDHWHHKGASNKPEIVEWD